MFFLENYNTRHLSFIQAVHRHAARIEDIEIVSNQQWTQISLCG